MSAVMSRPALDSTASPTDRSVDDLDAAICRLVTQMNAESYRMLVLVREFDDRFGWAKWTFKCCAEWLAWRCGISLSAAREKVRTAQALRTLPETSAAFAAGRVSYSKVRALTRHRDTDGGLRFERADGRTIPRSGYRAEDFVDDTAESPSAEGLFTAMMREPAAVYRIGRQTRRSPIDA